ncbi:peroxynitrite isomerase THAP4-like [Neodiprion fabricii]|uniref:peroxynitrite isomerase THAP4-like n=1 Tax=Neodiprion fabricii TaxID=2872261 RepID=UPI001ED95204|nr:peroxynitrite isomerase THAP4-like [Neodiprion fabricii]
MPHCAAIRCTHKSSAKSKAQLEIEKRTKISCHRFLKKIDERKIWINRMRLTEASLHKYPYLCSCHFSSDSFDRTLVCKIRLKDFAVPSIHNVQDVSNAAAFDNDVVDNVVVNMVAKEKTKIKHFGKLKN